VVHAIPYSPRRPRSGGLTYTGHGGTFNFIPHALLDLTKARASWRVCDHYPLWIEFVTE
jgi:hypothetical protein